MAPAGRSRGRPKKVGLKRIDAAIDALCQIGFQRSTVRKTIGDLLNVYGGDEGWPFIEEGYYKIVIEKILEEQEETRKAKEEARDDMRVGVGLQDDIQVDPAEKIGHESRTEGLNLQAINVEKAGDNYRTEGPIGQVAEAASIPSAWKDISCIDHASDSPGVALTGSNSVQVGGDETQLKRKRVPCYGWISESDDDEPEGYPAGCLDTW